MNQALLALLLAAAAPAAPGFLIAAGERFGPIREKTSRRDLDRLFGPRAATDREVGVGEGFCVPGSIVFAGTPDEIEIAWRDAGRTQVAFVRAMAGRGRWITRRGVRIGTPLRQVERWAGRALTFSGFGWDYGGRTLYREGRGELILWLDVDQPHRVSSEDYSRVSGDRPLQSDQPEVRKLPVRVTAIEQWWSEPSKPLIRDCTGPAVIPDPSRAPAAAK